MNTTVEWIANYALPLWGVLLLLAVLAGDLAWQRNARWQYQARADGRHDVVLRQHVGIALGVALLLLFAGVAWAIRPSAPGELSLFDTGLAESLRARLSPSALRMVAALTHLGDLLVVASAAVLILLILWLRRHRQLAGVWALALGGILPLNSGLKAVFQRARPLHDHGFVVEHSWSFPSGHAFGAIVFYGMLAYVLLRLLPPRFHRAVIGITVLLVGVIGISRILLQVHYFSDVLAGFASGAVWLLACIGVAEYLRGRPVSLKNGIPGAGL